MASMVRIKIDWDGHNYASCLEDIDIACVATGKTFEAVKIDMLDALKQHIEWMKEDGDVVPEELSGEWEPEWHLTTRAQLKYSESFITRKALANATGISIQQLSIMRMVGAILDRICSVEFQMAFAQSAESCWTSYE